MYFSLPPTRKLHPYYVWLRTCGVRCVISTFDFSRDEPSPYGAGVLRRHPSRITSPEECFNYTKPRKVGVDEICSRHSAGLACSGDSGSGQIYYKNDRAYITGVLSYGKYCSISLKEGKLTSLFIYLTFSEDLMDFSPTTIYHNHWICMVTGICPMSPPNKKEQELLKDEYYVYGS